MSNSECRVEIKSHIQAFKQEMINKEIEQLEVAGQEKSDNMELIKLINNLSDEYIISSALELALNNENFYETMKGKLVSMLENEMPF